MTTVRLPKEICGISFFYVVKYNIPYNSEKEGNLHDDLNMWLELEESIGLVDVNHDWRNRVHTIQITARQVSNVFRDLDEMNERFRWIIAKAGYVISDPIGDEDGNS